MTSIGLNLSPLFDALHSRARDWVRTVGPVDKALSLLEGRSYSTGALNKTVSEGETLSVLVSNTGTQQLAVETITARVGGEYRVTKTFNPTVVAAGTALDIRNKRSGAPDSATAPAERDGAYSGGDAFSPTIIGERKASADIGSSPGPDPVNVIDPGDSMLIELENIDSQGPVHASIDVDFTQRSA